MKKMQIGIDVGGTNIRAGLVSSDGKIISLTKRTITGHKQPSLFINFLTSLINETKKISPIKHVGLGIPGIVSAKDGIVFSSPHYPEWENFSIQKQLQSKIKIRVSIDNDANQIALGEAHFGAGKKLNSFLMLTLGTGIGGGIIINKKIFHGTNGFAGEFGHIVVVKDGNPCGCGSRGCLETYASQTGLKHLSKKAGLSLKNIPDEKVGHFLFEQAVGGNTKAKKIFEEFGTYLGIGIASLVNVTGIDNIVLGGGLSEAKKYFLASLKKSIRTHTYKKTAEGIKIHFALLGDKAGILGATQK